MSQTFLPANKRLIDRTSQISALPWRRVSLRAATAVAALLVFVLAFQGSRGLYEPDEGRYAAVAWQVVRSDQWVVPMLNHELPHYTKPPLTYWTLALGLRSLGDPEWGTRVPVGLAFVATVLLTYSLARHLAPGAAALAATIEATSLLPFFASNVVSTDTFLALWETVGVLGFVSCRWGRRSRWGPLLMWGGLAMAFLTKGPPGLLPLLPIVLFLLWERDWAVLRRIFSPVGLVLFLLLAGSWFVFVARRVPHLAAYFWKTETVGRMVGLHHRHDGLKGLLLVYGPVVLLGTFPWNLTWLVERLRRPGRRPRRAPDPAGRFLILWIVAPLAVFIFAQSRMFLYLLPLAVPASVLLARGLPTEPWARPAGRVLLGVWLVALTAIKVGAAAYPHHKDSRRFAQELQEVLPFAPGEIVFVEDTPRWGLELYLGCDVEEVVLRGEGETGTPAFQPLAETLLHEVGERETGQVYAVPPEHVTAFRASLGGEGYRETQVGEVSDGKTTYSLFQLETEEP